MSDANRTAVRVSREQTYKVPFAAPLMHPLRITSVGLAYTPETVTSNEIDSTRQIADQPLVGFSSGGDIPAELSIGNMDILMEGLYLNPWIRSPEVLNGASWKYGSGSTAATRISALTATTLTLAATSVLAGSTINSTGAAFRTGMLMALTGFGSGTAEQILRVAGSTATTVTVVGATPVAAPAVTARAKVVGFEGVAGDILSTTVGGNALTSTALDFTTLGLTFGQWIFLDNKLGNFGFSSGGGYARISAITANRLSFDIVPVGFAINTGAGKTIRAYFTDMIKNGVQDNFSYYIEEEFGLPVGTQYQYFRGQEVATRVLSADTKAIITDTITFIGADATPMSGVRQVGAVDLIPGTGTVLNSSTAVPLLLENGAQVTDPNFINSFTLSMDNAKRSQDAVGVLGAAGIGTGRINVTGTLNTYFGSPVLYNKVISNAVSSVTIAFNDLVTARSEIYDVPKLKFSSGAPEVSGVDTDIFVPLAFQALRDVTNGRDYTILCSRAEYLG